MSGYWDSSVVYSRRAAAIVACAATLQKASDVASGVGRAASSCGARAQHDAPASEELRARQDALVTELADIVAESQRVASAAGRSAVPERPADTDEAQLSSLQQAAGDLLSQADGLDARTVAISAELEALGESDAAAARVTIAAHGASDAVLRSRDLLERWSPEIIRPLCDEAESLITRAKSALREDDDARARLGDIASKDAADLRRRIGGSITEAQELEERQARRMYVLKALRSVCGDLGFRECAPPAYEGDDRRQGLLLSFDTRGKGIVSFRLTLDARIETDSGMDHRYCATDFGRLSESLESDFGMQAQFTDLGDEAPPIRKTARADELPKRSTASLHEE